MHSVTLHAAVAMLCLLLLLSANAETSAPSQAAEQISSLPRQNIASTNADPEWRPSAEQRTSVEAATMAYFLARDSNRAAEAYAFLSARLKDYQSPSAYQRRIEGFNAKAGPVRARRLRAVTWYKDSRQAGPGLYVAVDYSSDFSNLALHCGYVVWNEQPDGAFVQVREEENFIDQETMAKLKPDSLGSVRAQFRC
jgi:hypothetical protein